MNGNHQDVRELLPWYVNGTLDEGERRRVEEYLQAEPEAEREMRFLRLVRDGVRETGMQPPGELGLARLRRQIAAERGEAEGAARRGRAAQQRARWFVPLAAAAVLVIAVQGVLLVSWRPQPAEYAPLGGPGTSQPVLQVVFTPDASAGRIGELLREVEGELTGGPGASGVYRIALPADSSEAAVQAAIDALSAHPEVVSHVARD